MGVLQVGLETLESRPELVEAVLHALLALCMDEEGRVGVHEASGISSILRLLEVQKLPADLRELTAHLVLRLAYTAVNKNAIRSGPACTCQDAFEKKDKTKLNEIKAKCVRLPRSMCHVHTPKTQGCL